jgi:hypothetical protein
MQRRVTTRARSHRHSNAICIFKFAYVNSSILALDSVNSSALWGFARKAVNRRRFYRSELISVAVRIVRKLCFNRLIRFLNLLRILIHIHSCRWNVGF